MNSRSLRDWTAALPELAVFVLLVTIGIVGRWDQPEWNFTPVAAVAVFGGLYFRRWSVALLVPLAVVSISNLLLDLPPYQHPAMAIAVYASFLVPVCLGRQLRTGNRPLRIAAAGLLPATVFFLSTNFAHWLLTDTYATTVEGLGRCYVMAIPFYRAMLAGDLFYFAVVFGAYALAARLQWIEQPPYAATDSSQP
jgi:hypothetical protein